MHVINFTKTMQVDVAEELRAISQELKKMAFVLSMHGVSGIHTTYIHNFM